VKGDAMRLPFGAGSFDVVLALDAFEHFEDDVAAMRETLRVLRPGGLLVCTVPAFMALWSPHDEAYHHHRRYRRPLLVERLGAAGYRIERSSYSSMALFLPVLALRRWRRWRGEKPGESPSSDFSVPFPAPVEWLAGAITSAEGSRREEREPPLRRLLLAVARKPA
jgi:SAM-dependent methyltransferase